MCDTVMSCARDHLLPLLKEAANKIMGVPEEVADMKDELERIEEFINDAGRMAEAEEDNTRDGIKTKMKQLREAAFGIEDAIDEYMICEGHQSRDPGCAALPRETVDFVKTMILRLQIVHKIQNIKSQVRRINERSEKDGFQIQPFMEQGPSSSTANQNNTLDYLRVAPFFLEEDEVVGFDDPKHQLIRLLLEEGRAEHTIISVVGMGGLGKTTLAKIVFNNQMVINHFDYHIWITVSQSYTVEGLLREILHKLYKERNENPPQEISTMQGDSLMEEVRKYLQEKRYVILFDDVWSVHFWDEIQHVLINNDRQSRILITTRNMDVAVFCMRSSFGYVYQLKPLSPENSFALFCKKAFFDLNGCCPENLRNISFEIVKECEGLPLAIVAIAGLLSLKDRHALQWVRFGKHLSSEWEYNLIALKKILGLSYHDIPYHLKQCFLYFGIYPTHYEVKTARLIRQWIAEGLVKQERGKTSEEVAEEYLTHLIHRSLVQVSSFANDGKPRSCRVHYIVREMMLDKIQDLSFCHFISEIEDKPRPFSGMIRRLRIATSSNDLMESVESSKIRSLHIFRNEELPDSFVASIPSKYRLLRVLDFEEVPLYRYVPQNLGDLFHLRYLSFRNTKVTNLPGSIGMLHNLETLDIRQTMVREMPREINKLRKLRHLLAYDKSKGVGYGIRMQDDIGDIESLQTLREVEADHGGVELVKDLERLTQIRKLGLTNVKREYTSALCFSLNEMKNLEKLCIAATEEDEVLDLQFDVSAPVLRKLRLIGRLDKFPYWVRDLQNLVKLSLLHSMLTHDPLTSLKDLPNLLYLSILYNAYEGECLHFLDGGFRNLKQLVLGSLYNLNTILIDREALCSLEKFVLVHIPTLKKVPSGVYNLPNLKVFHVINMPDEFAQSIDRDRGQSHWITEQVPFASIADRFRA